MQSTKSMSGRNMPMRLAKCLNRQSQAQSRAEKENEGQKMISIGRDDLCGNSNIIILAAGQLIQLLFSLSADYISLSVDNIILYRPTHSANYHCSIGRYYCSIGRRLDFLPANLSGRPLFLCRSTTQSPGQLIWSTINSIIFSICQLLNL